MKRILLFILLSSIGAAAQLQRYDNFAATTASASGIGNLTQVIPNATITVFNQPAVGVSCAGGGCVAASTFTSRTGGTACGAGVPLTRPTSNTCLATTDLQGNFGFWAAAGPYQYCVAATNFTTQCYNVLLSLSATNRQFCDQFAGATFDVKVNACIAAVIAQGGGIADATGLIGAQSQTAEIDVGTTSVSGLTNNQISVALLLSPFLVDSLNINSPTSCGFKIFGESRIIGTSFGTTHSAQILGTATSNVSAALCTGGTGGQYVTVQGLQFYNPAGVGTFTNGMVYALNLIDTSSYSDLQISNQGGIGLHIRASCCQTVFRNIITDGNSAAGARPLVIESIQGDIGPINGIQLIGMSVDHAGTGQNEISIQHTWASNLNACSMTFTGLYIESNNTDVSSNLVNIDSCQTVNIAGMTSQFRANTGVLTGVAIHIVNTSVPAVNTNLTLAGFAYQNSGQMTCPYTVVSENYGGFLTPTEANCTLPFFGGGDGYTVGNLVQANRTVDFAESGNGAVARANHDACTGDTTSHTIKCSYNNGTAFSMTQTIGTGSVTTAGTAVNTLTCQAQTGITVTGAATTDNVVANIGATLPATWQTGIVLSAHVTATNTVTVYLCNPTATASITPAATQVNVRVTR